MRMRGCAGLKSAVAHWCARDAGTSFAQGARQAPLEPLMYVSEKVNAEYASQMPSDAVRRGHFREEPHR
jgi:hypothetical protein